MLDGRYSTRNPVVVKFYLASMTAEIYTMLLKAQDLATWRVPMHGHVDGCRT